MDIGSLIASFRDVLLASEKRSRADLQAYELDLMQKLLQHATQHVPFYRSRLGTDPQALNELAWMQLPVITRSVVQQQGSALHAAQIPPFAGTVRDGATSGSTGRPLRYRHEDLLDIASGAQTDRAFTWWRLDGRKALATFMSSYDDLAGRDGKQRGGWRYGAP